MNKLIFILLSLLIITGCSKEYVNIIRDKDYIIGCVAVTEQVNIGYFGQTGGIEACKLKCSENLPPNYTFEYTDPRVGCTVTVGK